MSTAVRTASPRERTRPTPKIEPRPVASPSRPRAEWPAAGAIVALLLGVYLANGDLLPTTDAIGNMHVALSLLDEGNVSFTALEKPFMFRWTLAAASGDEDVVIKRWTDTISGLPLCALYERGLLKYHDPQYFIVPAKRRDAARGQPLYVNTSGPGPGIAAAPLFAIAQFWQGKLATAPARMWYTAKFVAALYVAIAGGALYLLGRRFVGRFAALAVALSFGLGTCAWSISSQALWQHPSNELFLASGLLALVAAHGGRTTSIDPLAGVALPRAETQGKPRLLSAAGCGLALACATCCRPTSGMLWLSVAIYFLVTDRRGFLCYLVAGAPALIALAGYNTYYLGAPWEFGQTVAGHEIARTKVGTPGAWQTPLMEGLTGNLFSSSRGLFVFSPVLAFSLIGIWRAWRAPAYKALRAVSIGALLMLLVESKHYDWWGGWTYGYRHIVDLSVPLVALLIPAMSVLKRRRAAAIVFGAAFVWSIAVQVIGVLAYDDRWNALPASYELRLPGSTKTVSVATREEAKQLIARGAKPVGEVRRDIDNPKYRYRLWSWRENEIWYYLTRFRESREVRRIRTELARETPG